MTSRDFCFWLQGFFEINEVSDDPYKGLNTEQIKMIKAHLNLVFKHEIDPSMGDKKHQDELNKIHAADKSNDFGYDEPTNIHKPNPGWTDYPMHDDTGGLLRC